MGEMMEMVMEMVMENMMTKAKTKAAKAAKAAKRHYRGIAHFRIWIIGHHGHAAGIGHTAGIGHIGIRRHWGKTICHI
jgi:hypothetical protein